MGQSPSSKNYTDNPNDWILIQGNADLKNGKVAPRLYTSQLTKKADIGDIILTVRAPVGEVAITDYKAILGRGVASIKGNLFIYFALEEFKANNKWNMYSSGSTFDSITGKDLNNLSLFFPSEMEENKIGELLNKLDNLLTLYERKLKLLSQVKKYFLDNLFAEKEYPNLRFKGFTDTWEQREFTQILKTKDGIKRGPFGSALKKEYFIPYGNYAVYEQRNAIYNSFNTRYYITQDKFEELKKFELVPGDIIMSGSGTIGRLALIPFNSKPGIFNQALIRFRINEQNDNLFFLYFMRTPKLQKKLTNVNPGSAMVNLVPIKEIKKWKFPFPYKREQKRIVSLLSKMDSLLTLYEDKQQYLIEIKNTLLNAMFI